MKFVIQFNPKIIGLFLLMLGTLCILHYLNFNQLPFMNKIKTEATKVVRTMEVSETVQLRTPNSEAPSGISQEFNFLLKSEHKGATMLRRSETAWSRDDASCKGDKSFVRVNFRSPAGNTPMYVHPAENDTLVSRSIITGGVWERPMVVKYYNILKEEPNLQFVDIGANIGTYGITMAKLGRKTLLIDPLLKNVQKLCNTVIAGQFQDVYVIHNAMSSERFLVGFDEVENNVGGTMIRNVTSQGEETAYAIRLDDLLEVFNFTSVAMKMDVEFHEHRVIQGAERFFSQVDVRYLLMEWLEDKVSTGKFIVDFLTRHKMAPFHIETDKSLDIGNYKAWPMPGDIFWKKIN